MLFAAMGLLGTVLGLLLLAIGLLRSRAAAPWIPTCLIGFLVVEFVGSNLSSWASLAAVALLELVIGVCRIQEYDSSTEDSLPLTSVCAIPRLTKYQAAQRPEPRVVS